MKNLKSIVIGLLLAGIPVSVWAWGVVGVSMGSSADPTVSSASIPTTGLTLDLGLSATCHTGSGFSKTDLTLSASGGACTVSSVAQDDSSTLKFLLSREITSAETVTYSWAGTANGIERMDSGVDLASVTGGAVTNGSEVSGVSYLSEINFEETGAPSGCSSSGTVDYDSTATALRGSQSCLIGSTSGQHGVTVTFDGQDEVWIHDEFRMTAVGPSDNMNLIRLLDASNNELGWVCLSSTNHIKIRNGDDTLAADNGTFTVAANTKYHRWVRYKKGTGANGELDVWIGTSATIPETRDNYTASLKGSADCAKAVFYVNNAVLSAQMIEDHIIIDDASIGSVSE